VKKDLKQSALRRSQKAKASKTVVPSEKAKAQLASSSETKRLAMGALLTFYRLIRKMSRPDLADKAGMSASLLGMIENGVRLPTIEAIGKIGGHLGLTSEQRLQLRTIAGYSLRDEPEAPGWEVLPEDVLNGEPIFLRDMLLESEFQDKLEIDDVWMVTRRPMALHEPVLSWLRKKLLNTGTRYTYFVDRRSGEEDLKTLLFRLNLEAHPEWQAKDAARKDKGHPAQLAFVLSPPALGTPTHTLAIFNPLSGSKPKFGRTAFYQGDEPLGVYAMDPTLVKEVISLLLEVYPDCKSNPGQWFPKDLKSHGTFSLISADKLTADKD